MRQKEEAESLRESDVAAAPVHLNGYGSVTTSEGIPLTSETGFKLTPQVKRKRSRPKQTWRRSVTAEMKNVGLSWPDIKLIAQDRARWQCTLVALCPNRGT
ncbi:unnamed protein product [Euphydryas editha]|uniref:Uncharacterized protein n=1 Tax=Euphydryas editha TaxID=104508 RepID=A0AAU9UU79_EUPED|nr:unnamed protein product [Euphydryas editha]